MKQLHSCLCLFAILFQAISASTFLDGDGTSLLISKIAPLKSRKSRSKARPVTGELVRKKKLPNAKNLWTKKDKRAGKDGKGKGVMVKENSPKLLSELLAKSPSPPALNGRPIAKL